MLPNCMTWAGEVSYTFKGRKKEMGELRAEWNEIFQKNFFFTVYLGEQNYKNDDKLVSVQVRWSYNK